MKFIVDNQLPPALVEWLASKGHDARHVFPMGLAQAEDAQIWAVALEQDAVIITKDSDFAERRTHAPRGPRVVWLRIGNTATDDLFAFLERRWSSIESSIALDAVVEVR